jgi:hypothetical protein
MFLIAYILSDFQNHFAHKLSHVLKHKLLSDEQINIYISAHLFTLSAFL